jgi:ankyrin repeat protein
MENITKKLFIFILSICFSFNCLSGTRYKTSEEIAAEKKVLNAFKEKIINLIKDNDKLDHIQVEENPLRDSNIFEFPDILKALVEKGIEVDVKGYLNQTPLHAAIHRRNLECVSILLKAGADPNYKPVHFFVGKFPLEEAIADGQLEIVRELLRFDADPQAISKHGNTLLMEAFSEGVNPLGLRENRIEIIKELILNGANPLQINYEGLNSLQYAQITYLKYSNGFLRSKKDIDAFKETVDYLASLEIFSKLTSDSNKPSEENILESCVICLEEITQEPLKPCVTCTAVYCVPCINEWVRKNGTCPTCRGKLDFSQPQKQINSSSSVD